MKNKVKENATYLMHCWFYWAAKALLFSSGCSRKWHWVARFSISEDG